MITQMKFSYEATNIVNLNYPHSIKKDAVLDKEDKRGRHKYQQYIRFIKYNRCKSKKLKIYCLYYLKYQSK